MLGVSGVYVYPVKGCRGLAVDEAVVSDRGFENDRRLMIVDEHGTFVSQREYPRLAVVETAIEGGAVVLRAPGLGEVRVPIRDDGTPVRVRVWKDEVDALDQGGEAAAFVSAALGEKASLVRMPETTFRQVDLDYARAGDRVSFADAYPFLVIGDSSLVDLSSRVGEKVPMNRFRPSITIAGAEPFAEDHWKGVRIGAVTFHFVKPCARCAVTTVDQATGVRGVEPLRTMSELRRVGEKVLFGQNAVHDGRGTIRVGDLVHPIETR